MSSLIIVMIDGVSAGYVQRHGRNLPNLNALARRGLQVERLAADVPATSLPGRTSIVTGVAASEHGIFGNVIWDGQRFRYANPDDVLVPTLSQAALDAGLEPAVVGFGMIRPEDAAIFKGPWWANEMLQRSRDEEPIPADESWLRTARVSDGSPAWQRLIEDGYPREVPNAYQGDTMHYLLAGAAGDRMMMRWSAGLAGGTTPPQLLITEILVPDTLQHLAGQDHSFSDWAIGYADELVGTLVAELERSGKLGSTTIMVTSDHGHGKVERALYTDRLLPGRPLACEGSVLIAQVDGERDARSVEQELAPHGVQRLDSEYLPERRRGEVALYCAPDGCSFQPRSAEGAAVDGQAASGPAKYRSSHGFRPGHPDDERFAIVAGPGVEVRTIQRARANDIATTAAALLGIGSFGNGRSLV